MAIISQGDGALDYKFAQNANASMPVIGGASAGGKTADFFESMFSPNTYRNRIEQDKIALQAWYNTNSAREAMKFSEHMSNTAHQREVVDLIKAGLNPVLSARLGGASTPGGTSSSVSQPSAQVSKNFFQDIMDAMVDLGQTAMLAAAKKK